MRKTQVFLAAALVTAIMLTLGVVSAQQQTAHTIITIPDMDCAGCAKGVVAEVTKVPGVGSVTPYVQTRQIVIVPRSQAQPSPRGLWEAVQKADKQPTKLQGPYGTFTAKPQS